MKTLGQIVSFFSVAVLLGACGVVKPSASTLKEAWDSVNDPLNLGEGFARNYAALPPSGSLNTIPWADSYWPTYMGGINARWGVDSSNRQKNFNYYSPSFDQLRQMSKQQIASLSPAEKYSILISDYSYSMVRAESARVNPNAQGWEGICHGWAPASLNFSEPNAVELANNDGIVIPFGSSDVKALLSYYQGQIAKAPMRVMGARCNWDFNTNPEARNYPECRDVNAGAFHVALANLVGLQKKGFVADLTIDAQVWNHPIFAYSFKALRVTTPTSNYAPGTVKEVTMETTINYRVESYPQWSPTNSESSYTKAKVFQYIVELNAADEIIGGKWLTAQHPDFLWSQERPSFEPNYQALEYLYDHSIGQPYPGSRVSY